MEAHLFRVNVQRPDGSKSLLIPPDDQYFIPNGTVLNDGSFGLDAPTPILLDSSVTRIHVNFPEPVWLSKVYTQSADDTSIGYYATIEYAFAAPRALPLVQTTGSGSANQSIATSRGLSSTNAPSEGSSYNAFKTTETVIFFLTPDTTGSPDSYSIRFGFEVQNSVSCKLIANNGITRSFYQNDYTTIIPSTSKDLHFQLISSEHIGSDTTVTVKKIA